MADEVFSAEEAEAILERAVRRRAHGGSAVSGARLRSMADELDIAPEELEMAILEREEERQDAKLRTEYIAARRGTILPHLAPYFSVSFMLFMIWLLTSHGRDHPWFLYPMMGWGIGVVSHLAVVWPTSGIAFEEGFAEYKRKVAQKEEMKSRRAAKRAAKTPATSKVSEAERAAEQELADATLGTGISYNTKPTVEDDSNVLRAGQR